MVMNTITYIHSLNETIDEELSLEQAAKNLIQDLSIYGIIKLLKKDTMLDEVLYDIVNLEAALGRK